MQVSNLTQLAPSQIQDNRGLTHSRVASPRSDESHAVTRSLTDSKITTDSYDRGDRLRGVVEKAAVDSAALTELVGTGRALDPETGGGSKPQTLTDLTDSVPTSTKSGAVADSAVDPVAVTNLAGAGSPATPETGKAFSDLSTADLTLAARIGGGSKPQTLTDLTDSVPTNTKSGAVAESVVLDPAEGITGAQSLEDEAASLTNRGSSISRIRNLVNDLRSNFIASAIRAHNESDGEHSVRLGIKVQDQLIAHLESLVNQSPPEPIEAKTFLNIAADQQRQAIDAFILVDSLTESGTQFTSIA